MTDTTRPAAPQDSEWTVGWRIALAAAIANGTGVSLMFYVFSMFLIPMSAELGMTRSETGIIQSLVVTAALGAPLIGRLTDTLGFRTVYVTTALILGLTAIAQGTVINNATLLGISVAAAAFFGSGNSSITLTRPITAHFSKHRGLALGLVGIGVSITAIIFPPLLHFIIEDYGWRAGFLTLAGFGLGIGLPLTLLIMPRTAATARIDRHVALAGVDLSFLKTRDFWLLAGANMLIGIATSGAISQMSPMIQERGLSAAVAALAVSAFAAGQFIGKLVGGWFLDRFEPRRVAALLIMVPATGYVVLLAGGSMAWLAVFAAGLIGLLQGADIDIFAYLTSRRFGFQNYGTIFGSLHALGWIGNVGGILVFSASFDRLGSYAPAQALALVTLLLGSLLFWPLRLAPDPVPDTTS
ncbi:MFS transporter [Novosphingobium sp. B 225]|uniref:MFS transporter n=1 Tax=Novosphingobium sp. B 225 TaxID=1961849 RepID=UPI000B4B5133|nr:MFS transporter [Novosphingobium sp. B 225]